MNTEEKLQYVKEHFLGDAIESIKVHRRYWNPSISRTMTGALSQALEEGGYPVTIWEIPPQWEHVFYLREDASSDNDEIIRVIAEERSRQMEAVIDDAKLSK